MRRLLLLLALAGCVHPAGEPAREVAPPDATYTWVPVATGFIRPVGVLWGDGMSVLEQCGRIVAADTDEAWLDISDHVRCGGEQGFLGAAYDEAGRLYLSYTDRDGDSILSRYRNGTEEVLVHLDQPASNHNGGHIVFGPDGMLYWGLGDGGGAGDAYGNGQDTDTLMGAILRIDVSPDIGYAVPDDNPFTDGAAPEVWMYGLRNPWRFSFDGGDLWIGDVGQSAWEEIDHVPAGTSGSNFGWPVWEGRHAYARGDAPGHVPPVAEYGHDDGDCSVTGGHVVHDPALPSLEGHYLFGDYCSGTVRFVVPDGDGWATGTLMGTDFRITSFSEGPDGGVLLVDQGGGVYRLQQT